MQKCHTRRATVCNIGRRKLSAGKRGFTLIELMIVVAIIGLLAAIAIPQYQDYVKRTYVGEGMTIATAAKTGVSVFWSTYNKMPNNNYSVGLSMPASINSATVKSVEVSNGGQITITFNNKVTDGASLLLTPSNATNASIMWVCSKGLLIQPKWLPDNCR